MPISSSCFCSVSTTVQKSFDVQVGLENHAHSAIRFLSNDDEITYYRQLHSVTDSASDLHMPGGVLSECKARLHTAASPQALNYLRVETFRITPVPGAQRAAATIEARTEAELHGNADFAHLKTPPGIGSAIATTKELMKSGEISVPYCSCRQS